MAQVATYVFLDLETTSLPSMELNKTKIVELCLLALKRSHMLEMRTCGDGSLPRVQHKLTMCFNPGRLIHPGATEASGLDNFLVEHETPFVNKVFNTIHSFLESLEKPVCLIAENGHKFDFPIIKNHFVRLNVALAEDILCADSLHAFYDILNLPNITLDAPDIPQTSSDAVCTSTLSHDELDEVNCKKKKSNNGETLLIQNGDIEDVNGNDTINISKQSPISMQQQNETTPKRYHPIIRPAKKINQVRRKLHYDGNEKPKHNFKLGHIYERVLNRPAINAHRAENDCIMAAQISIALIDQFVDWVDKNHCAFSEVQPMRPGVPLGY